MLYSPRKLNTETFENYQTETDASWTELNKNLAEMKSSVNDSLSELTHTQTQGRV